VTGADCDDYTCTRLYQKVHGFLNNAPWAASVIDCQPTAGGLYDCLQVGTSSGADDVRSGTYTTPLMESVGQATEMVLAVQLRLRRAPD
jgi:hypothetical protein